MTATRPNLVEFDQLLLLIGRLNYSWTNTESLLIHMVAGLSGTDKETATIIFLTLNTTRARVDLVERLAKMDRRNRTEKERVLEATGDLMRLSALRNRYNHCIYAFDAESGNARTILMRIADRKSDLRIGQVADVDEQAITDIETSLQELAALNRRFWGLIRDYRYPA